MTQRIAGEPTEAMRGFLERRVGAITPSLPPLAPYVGTTDLPKVTEPGISEHPIWVVTERKKRIRSEVAKRQRERRRVAAVAKVGRPFVAEYPGRCAFCHVRFAVRTMIAKGDPLGYVHVDCLNPQVVPAPHPQISPVRQSVREAIAASRYAPREAG